MNSHLRLMLPGLILLPSLAHNAGGWDVITVQHLPDHVIAGQPIRLTYTVRQHGVSRLRGLTGSVVGKAGNVATRATATADGPMPGVYAATLNLPRPGDWTITIHSGFGKNSLTLLPLTAVAAGAPAPSPLSDAERGRRLFVAKGCVGCHVHAQTNVRSTVKAGPELTGRRFPEEYLARFLADPSIKPPASRSAVKMPDLDLEHREIAALIAFINTDRRQISAR